MNLSSMRMSFSRYHGHHRHQIKTKHRRLRRSSKMAIFRLLIVEILSPYWFLVTLPKSSHPSPPPVLRELESSTTFALSQNLSRSSSHKTLWQCESSTSMVSDIITSS